MKNHRHGIEVLQGEERKKDAVSSVWRSIVINFLKLTKRQSYRDNDKYQRIWLRQTIAKSLNSLSNRKIFFKKS